MLFLVTPFSNTRPKNYLPLVHDIQNKVFTTASSHGVYPQFIPGHKGVPCNEAAAHKIRCLETALARLRVGHSGLRSHLYLFNVAEDSYCSFNAEENIDHLFSPAFTTLLNVPL
ncbi:hypothetical protein FHG87_005113 [Trinorchestia longiramus]|nr:hypothetical protein FHG87_005113 [Trinorchestia longiramus]